MTNSIIQIFESTAEMAEEIARMFFDLVKTTDDKPVHIALSGGNTPKTIFQYLNEKYGEKLANNRFHFWWGDDRCVPPSHNDSNYKWAYELWLKNLGIPEENIHRVIGENNPGEEAIRYAEELRKYTSQRNGLPVIDLNILGLGEDGHTASIFPSCMNLLNSDKWCEVAVHPVSGQKRITFTGRVLNNSEKIVFLSTGASKAPMVKNVAIDAKPKFPASHIKPHNGNVIWLLDKGAASLI